MTSTWYTALDVPVPNYLDVDTIPHPRLVMLPCSVLDILSTRPAQSLQLKKGKTETEGIRIPNPYRLHHIHSLRLICLQVQPSPCIVIIPCTPHVPS